MLGSAAHPALACHAPTSWLQVSRIARLSLFIVLVTRDCFDIRSA